MFKRKKNPAKQKNLKHTQQTICQTFQKILENLTLSPPQQFSNQSA